MILAAEKSLFNGSAHLPYGIYNDLIKDVSTKHWDRQGLIFKDRRLSRKTWIFFGVYTPDLICGIAIADAGVVATSFAYFYSFKDNVFVEDSQLVPLGFPASFDPNLNSDWQLGKYSIKTTGGTMNLEYHGKFDLKITAQQTNTGASIVAPSAGGRPFNFTFKNVCLPVELNLKYKGQNYAATGEYGAIDFTKGFPPRETIWNWLAFTGTTESGKKIGVNLVKHFNSDLENILWLDGEKTELSPATFTMNKPLDKSNWHIQTHDGILDCTLVPNGARKENVNALIMKSIFVQTYGRISGTITINGVAEKFTATGVAEDHHAVW
jgi:hypothetical protein